MKTIVTLANAAKLAICAAALQAQAWASPPAPSFELRQIDGSGFVRLTDFVDRPVLLNFWGSECPPCARELPLLFAQARSHPDLQFFGIAVDDRANASRFLMRQTPTYPQLIAGPQPEVLMRRFGNRIGALPYTVVLNRQHRICASHVGELDPAWLDAARSACIPH
ncbi:TlpA family protein disulfide reductase [Niveibacterium terrae]|uniref:TlpA family protein disulfide reductase n=1 Tax=Niveibacterium terrae TaxID=3373598 RepID=UPI003A95921C